MTLDRYFATLKLELGVTSFALVQDTALRRTSPPEKQKDPQEHLRDALRTSATKFSIDDCDEPLYCPARHQSSECLFSLSTDSIEALVSIDDSYRASTVNQDAVEEGEDSRWS